MKLKPGVYKYIGQNRDVRVISECTAWWCSEESYNCIWAEKTHGILFVVKRRWLEKKNELTKTKKSER